MVINVLFHQAVEKQDSKKQFMDILTSTITPKPDGSFKINLDILSTNLDNVFKIIQDEKNNTKKLDLLSLLAIFISDVYNSAIELSSSKRSVFSEAQVKTMIKKKFDSWVDANFPQYKEQMEVIFEKRSNTNWAAGQFPDYKIEELTVAVQHSQEPIQSSNNSQKSQEVQSQTGTTSTNVFVENLNKSDKNKMDKNMPKENSQSAKQNQQNKKNQTENKPMDPNYKIIEDSLTKLSIFISDKNPDPSTLNNFEKHYKEFIIFNNSFDTSKYDINLPFSNCLNFLVKALEERNYTALYYSLRFFSSNSNNKEINIDDILSLLSKSMNNKDISSFFIILKFVLENEKEATFILPNKQKIGKVFDYISSYLTGLGLPNNADFKEAVSCYQNKKFTKEQYTYFLNRIYRDLYVLWPEQFLTFR